ncbi:MAG: LysR substrate-binding domain-containing protein [Methylococcales bacterium]|nr:LysR substrate-binding domain-containing protein [Methylococcales bacterium]
MNLNQIELLRVLQETDFNLSKAAEKMCVVQSAVSRQLQMFEVELGAPLFERNGKKLIGLTLLGKRIMQEVATINQAKQNIQTIAADFMDSEHGTIHIATTHAQAKYFLPAPIQRFREKYPGVRIYMQQSSPEHLIDQLHQHKADVAICTEKVQEDTELVTKDCYEWHHAAVMPHGHPLCEGEMSLQRLANYPILTYSFGFTGRSAIESALQKAGLELDVFLSAADSDVIKTYVRAGLGVGLITGMAYDADVDSDLTARSLADFIPSSKAKIAYLRNNYLPSYVQHFIAELLAAGKNVNA